MSKTSRNLSQMEIKMGNMFNRNTGPKIIYPRLYILKQYENICYVHKYISKTSSSKKINDVDFENMSKCCFVKIANVDSTFEIR